MQSDHLQFRFELADRPLTRRGILSTVSSIYDPLGLVAPFLLQGKRILQAICQDGTHWDDPIPDHLRIQWVKWREELGCLAKLKVPRCYKPNDFGEVKTIELHFSDASTYGYGQCSYLRMTNSQGRIHRALVMAKSRVTPSKPITVPRLELTAALLSVKASAFLQRELQYGVIPEVFWTDSEVVLGYISNDALRFHTFVANRVQSIREYTTPGQWRKVHTKENPADKASRGLSAQELLSSHSWCNGPEFLGRPLNEQVGREEPATISDSDPEVRKVHSLAIKVEPFANLIEHLQYFSDWNRARRAVALLIRLQKRCKGRQANGEAVQEKRGSNITEPISVDEICQAELEIIRTVQREAFPREMKLRHGMPTQQRAEERSVKKASVISQLDPFVHESGVLRVGGRIKHASIPFKEKHPSYFPRRGM